MNWYYAVGGQQQGPVDDTQLDTLIQSGQINQETLVWREGMPSWQPLRQARAGATASAGTPPMTGAPTASAGIGDVVCAECRGIFTKDNAIQYGTAWVCATCKPIFLQKLREGAPAGNPAFQSDGPFDAAAFIAGIRERGYRIDIGNCVARGWSLVMANLGVSIATVAIVYACLIFTGLIPCVGGLVQLVIQGPLMGGLYMVFLRMIRRQDAAVGDAFSGFSTSFLQLFLVGLITGMIIFVCMIPAIVVIALSAAATKSDPHPLVLGIAFIVTALPIIYLTICWLFSMPLVIDKRLDFWPAMELSRKVVTMHWLSVFLLTLVCGLITIAGAFALCVGILVAAPVAMASLTYAYEDIFSGGSSTQI